jgi:hypothetical protein
MAVRADGLGQTKIEGNFELDQAVFDGTSILHLVLQT